MSRNILLYVVLAILLMLSCGQFTTPVPLNTPVLPSQTSSLPALNGEWTINMKHTGGIMGLSRSIKISSDGKFTIVDERANKTIKGEFSADELSKLMEQEKSAKYMIPTQPDGMVCSDCFIYDLEIKASGENFIAQLNDISLPNSGLESLVSYLRDLIDNALKS